MPTQGCPMGEDPTCPEFLRLWEQVKGGKRVLGALSHRVPQAMGCHWALPPHLVPTAHPALWMGVLPPTSTRAWGPHHPDSCHDQPRVTECGLHEVTAEPSCATTQPNPTDTSMPPQTPQTPQQHMDPDWHGMPITSAGFLHAPPPPLCLSFPNCSIPRPRCRLPEEQLFLMCQLDSVLPGSTAPAQQPAPRGQPTQAQPVLSLGKLRHGAVTLSLAVVWQPRARETRHRGMT